MAIRLSPFEMPHNVQLDEATKTATYTRFTAEPFEIGYARTIGFTGFSDGAVELLRSYRWPGNVRELKNVIERAVLLGTPPLILPDDLLLSAIPTPTDTLRKDADAENAAAPLPLQTIEEMERDLIRRTVEHYEWNKTRSAKSLGIDRSTLDRKLKQYSIEPKGE